MRSSYSYQGALEASERINWRIDDIIGGENVWIFPSRLCPSRWRR